MTAGVSLVPTPDAAEGRKFCVRLLVFGLACVASMSAAAAGCDPQARATSKTPPHGLVSMGDIGFIGGKRAPNNALTDLYARGGIFSGVALNVVWAQLEPAEGRFDLSAIDSALAAVCDYNRQYPDKPLAVSLRVWAGVNAPPWVKELGGAPVVVTRRGAEISIGRFWSSAYRQAWSALQQELGRVYDADPLIWEAANSSCSSNTDEPFILSLDGGSLANLHSAGLSDAAYQACLENSYLDYGAWRVTPIVFPFNVFYHTDAQPRADLAYAEKLMGEWRQRLRGRGVLANHALGVSTAVGAGNFAMSELGVLRETLVLEALKRLGAPIELQLFSPRTEPAPAITSGLSYGAEAIELWDGACPGCSFTRYSEQELSQWAAEIERRLPSKQQ